MCVASAAKRRRKQAKQGYIHIDKRHRPHYSCSSGGVRLSKNHEKKK